MKQVLNINDGAYRSSKIVVRNRNKVALVISSYQPNKDASLLLRVALDSITHCMPEECSIWVIDVGSPEAQYLVTQNDYKNVNFVFTDYVPRSWQGTALFKRLVSKLFFLKPPRHGSYANGWTLEFGRYVFKQINYHPEFLMTLQMDVMFTSKDLISSLLEKFDEKTAAVGVRQQKSYNKEETILHSLGCLWRTKYLDETKTSFMPNFPSYDVGEEAIVKVKSLGMKVDHLRNTFSDSNPDQLINLLENIELRDWQVDRSFNDNGDLVFLHLGRGIIKSAEKCDLRVSIDDWVKMWNKFKQEMGQK